jgi:sulfite reductase beta subunit-like hemoprotein
MRAGSNAVEATKASAGGDGLRVREQLPRLIGQGYESLTTSEKDLLKWVGVFFRKPTPGKFMMRVRMPNGFTGSCQLRAIADLSRRLGNCVLDITTRQQIQLRGFELGSVTEIWEKLRGVDLHSLQTGMDNVRNINGCALSGLTLNELFDASLVVAELDSILVGTNGNPEFTNLPRKFNITTHGYEHSVVNMFLIPAGMFFRAPVSVGQWWWWNQLPVTIGNIVSGALFTGALLYLTYGTSPQRGKEPVLLEPKAPVGLAAERA